MENKKRFCHDAITVHLTEREVIIISSFLLIRSKDLRDLRDFAKEHDFPADYFNKTLLEYDALYHKIHGVSFLPVQVNENDKCEGLNTKYEK